MTEPSARTHAPAGFMCGSFGGLVLYRNRPTREVAAEMAEDLSGWLSAAREQGAPAGVIEALSAAAMAASGWVDWIDRRNPRNVVPMPPRKDAS